jgi:hypothetical protein
LRLAFPATTSKKVGQKGKKGICSKASHSSLGRI